MRLSRACGLDVPRTWLFQDRWTRRADIECLAYAVERFDFDKRGNKIKMLDFCSLMGRSPEDKYDVSTEELFDCASGLLNETDYIRLAETYLFGWLVGNGDMHAKNFSVFVLSDGSYALAPVYDMLSTWAVMGDDTLALPLNGTTTPKTNDVADFFIPVIGVKRAEQIAERIQNEAKPYIDDALRCTSKKGWAVHKFAKRFSERISRRCTAFLDCLERMTPESTDIEPEVGL